MGQRRRRGRMKRGVQIMRILGRNMVWTLKLVENGKGSIDEPQAEHKTFMNFIR